MKLNDEKRNMKRSEVKKVELRGMRDVYEDMGRGEEEGI